MTEYVGGDLWMLADCCKDVEKYDIRNPGPFKNEFEGDGAIALNSRHTSVGALSGRSTAARN